MTNMTGKKSPWGKIQNSNTIIGGIVAVSTASHGGIKLSRERNATMPEYLRQPGGWYEEDSEWCLPYVVFQAELLLSGDERAKRVIIDGKHISTFKNWFPDLYEKHFGVVLQPGESHKKDEKVFYETHANDWLVVCAWGDYKDGIPEGYVGVIAHQGGRHAKHGETYPQERFFLIPADEYRARGPFSFVVDTVAHEETDSAWNVLNCY